VTIETYEIVGTVLTAVMAINGFFLKNVYSDMQFIKIELAKLIAQHDNTAKDALENSKEIYKLRERVHSLEGAQNQLLQFIEDFNKK
jgi:uncharacterized protein YlxW (UPF0749 family)